MSKKIDAARKQLNKALKKHARVVGSSAVSMKKAQRAAAGVYQATEEYAAAVQKKTGLASPFEGIVPASLEPATIASLEAERDKLSTRPVKTVG